MSPPLIRPNNEYSDSLGRPVPRCFPSRASERRYDDDTLDVGVVPSRAPSSAPTPLLEEGAAIEEGGGGGDEVEVGEAEDEDAPPNTGDDLAGDLSPDLCGPGVVRGFTNPRRPRPPLPALPAVPVLLALLAPGVSVVDPSGLLRELFALLGTSDTPRAFPPPKLRRRVIWSTSSIPPLDVAPRAPPSPVPPPTGVTIGRPAGAPIDFLDDPTIVDVDADPDADDVRRCAVPPAVPPAAPDVSENALSLVLPILPVFPPAPVPPFCPRDALCLLRGATNPPAPVDSLLCVLRLFGVGWWIVSFFPPSRGKDSAPAAADDDDDDDKAEDEEDDEDDDEEIVGAAPPSCQSSIPPISKSNPPSNTI